MLKNLFLITLLFTVKLAAAQSGVVVAGESVSSSGGSISYSVGQTDFIIYNNTVNAGIQQTYDKVNLFPVVFLKISAVKQDKKVLVKWQTSSEINSSHFVAQRCADGSNFLTDIGTVSAAGNSIITSYYSLVDPVPIIGTNYYRVKQVDKDGKYSYSEVVAVGFSSSITVSCYPNPSSAFVKLSISNISNGWIYQLFDNSGRILKTASINNIITTIDISQLPSASYTLKVFGPVSEVFIMPIIKR
jgi:hypothetical protein